MPEIKPIPARRRRACCSCLAGGGLFVLILAGIMAWLTLQPVSPPPYALLSRLPEQSRTALEIRGGPALWSVLRQNNVPTDLASSALVETLDPDGERHLNKRILTSSDEIDKALSAAGGQIGRTLGGSIAIDPVALGEGPFLLIHLDRLSDLLLRAFLRNAKDGMAPLGSGPKTLYAARVESRLAALAPTPETLRWGLKNLRPPASPDSSLPARGVLIRYTAATPDAPVQALSAQLRLEETDAVVDYELHLSPEPLMQLGLGGEVSARASAGQNRPALRTAGEEGLSLSGWTAPELALDAAGRMLWDEAGRPLRGEDEPAAILYWEWLREGILQHSDGRWTVRIRKPEPVQSPVPPAPALQMAWGVEGDTREAQSFFLDSIRRLVSWYRAPGGPELYQAVREETRLDVAPNGGSIHLHPLFFNHMQPTWRFGEDRGTLWTAPPPPEVVQSEPFRCADDNSMLCLTDVAIVWHLDAAWRQGLEAFLRDKIELQGLVEEEQRPHVLRGVRLVLAAAETVPAGALTATLHRTRGLSPTFTVLGAGRIPLVPRKD